MTKSKKYISRFPNPNFIGCRHTDADQYTYTEKQLFDVLRGIWFNREQITESDLPILKKFSKK